MYRCNSLRKKIPKQVIKSILGINWLQCSIHLILLHHPCAHDDLLSLMLQMWVGGHSVWTGTHWVKSIVKLWPHAGLSDQKRTKSRSGAVRLQSNYSKHNVVPSLNTACVTNYTFDSCFKPHARGIMLHYDCSADKCLFCAYHLPCSGPVQKEQ